MFGLMFPYNLLVYVAFTALVFGAGVMKGMDWQSSRTASEHLVAQQRFIERNKTIVVADNKALAAAAAKNSALEAENDRLQEEARAHATSIPDPVACHLAPERMRTIRRAWGAVDANPGNPERPVPRPDDRPAPDIGRPQRSGSVGRPVGQALSTVQGTPPGAGESRQPQRGE
jgi:hypothetical protein